MDDGKDLELGGAWTDSLAEDERSRPASVSLSLLSAVHPKHLQKKAVDGQSEDEALHGQSLLYTPPLEQDHAAV